MKAQFSPDVGLLFLWSLFLVGLIAILGGFLHYRRERLLTHAERMKALDLGRDVPDDAATARIKAVYGSIYGSSGKPEGESGGTKPLAVQCYSTTGWACGGGFVFAFLSGSNPGVAYAIAGATGAIGVTGLICGTVLASRAPESATPSVASKPRFDPEAI